MVLSCIIANNDMLVGKSSDALVRNLCKRLNECGVSVSSITTIENHPEKIQNAIEHSYEKNILVIGESNATKNNNIKKAIAKFAGVSILENQIAKTAVTNYYKSINTPVLYEDENEFYLPEHAECIINKYGALQGFFIKAKDTKIIYLPFDEVAMPKMYEESIFPSLLDNFELNYDYYAVKTFGISEADILSILKDILNNKYKITFYLYPDGLDVGIILKYNISLDKNIVNDYLRTVYERLNKYIYANEDVSLYKRVFELLKLSNKTIAISEGCTKGYITSKLFLDNKDMGQRIVESVYLPSDKAKIDTLKVSKTILNNYTSVSPEGAYEIAASLIENSGSDIVVVTTDKTTTADLKNEFCYIAVGDSEGIHIYRNSFASDYENTIKNISNTAMFYLIKKLKQNDLLLNKTIV